jgi:hypothetical protein
MPVILKLARKTVEKIDRIIVRTYAFPERVAGGTLSRSMEVPV